MEIQLGRCANCSVNADTSIFGYFLGVNNCSCESVNGPCRCDVQISNRGNRYECTNVSSISDCVDRLTYCDNPNIPDPNQDLQAFCDSTPAPGETWTKLGDTNKYFTDGNVMWNLQMQASPCGSARTALFDDQDQPFPQDQAPNCLPYSENFMGNTRPTQCLSGNVPMIDICTNDTCSFSSYSDCCISDSNCSSTILGCQGLKDLGYKLCSENPALSPCKNPCGTNIQIPAEDPSWKEDICEFFCPSYPVQYFWFNVEYDDEIEDPGDSRYNTRICSEEYYNLCKLVGCTPDPECKKEWANQSNQQGSSRSYSMQSPQVFFHE